MRISDWSSDVCSSDLAARRTVLTRPALELTSMPLLPSRSFTHRPRVPLALVPTVENPIGVNVTLLLPPERLALALSTMEECMVLSRSTVLTPLFVITAIQRLTSEARQLGPVESRVGKEG